LPSNYSTTLNLPNGNHTLWVGALFRFKINATNNMTYNTSDERLSQIVNFEVSAPPNPSPTVPEFSWLIILPLLLSVFSVVEVLRHRKTVKA
jgi:hypothetical protein